MYCAKYPRVTNDMGSMMGLKAFIAAVLGGIGVIPGAMLGGILVGLIEIFVKLFAPGWYEAITYAILSLYCWLNRLAFWGRMRARKFRGWTMERRVKISYVINFLGVLAVFLLFVLLFESRIFGAATQYIKGICTTACYTIIMVASLNLVVGCMGEFSSWPRRICFRLVLMHLPLFPELSLERGCLIWHSFSLPSGRRDRCRNYRRTGGNSGSALRGIIWPL